MRVFGGTIHPLTVLWGVLWVALAGLLVCPVNIGFIRLGILVLLPAQWLGAVYLGRRHRVVLVGSACKTKYSCQLNRTEWLALQP